MDRSEILEITDLTRLTFLVVGQESDETTRRLAAERLIELYDAGKATIDHLAYVAAFSAEPSRSAASDRITRRFF